VAVLFTIIQAIPLEEIRQRNAWLYKNANGWDEEFLPWEVMDDTTKKYPQHSNDIITKSLTSLYTSDSDPTNGRILKIYNKWRGLLAMDKNGKIYAAATGESREGTVCGGFPFPLTPQRVLENFSLLKYW
jgi:hypothetical protein